jgi:hypothetical protein
LTAQARIVAGVSSCLRAHLLRVSLPLVSGVLLSGVAGCGSQSPGTVASSGSGELVFTLAKTRSCLLGKGAQIGGRLDFVASTATEGAFVVHLPGNAVAISFGQTVVDGASLQTAYQRFALANVRTGLTDVLRRYDNVVTLWHEHPQAGDLALVVGCLK